MSTFFTADHHFGHKNIIRHQNRPFNSANEMDKTMIIRWNEVVGPSDVVYHLGDFTLGNQLSVRNYLIQLNGEIRILYNPWHHDKRWIPYLGTYDELQTKSGQGLMVIGPMVVIENIAEKPIILCHYPIAQWDRKHYGSWHLHGHSHGAHSSDKNMMDVGVDCHDFYPVSLDYIREKFYQRKIPVT